MRALIGWILFVGLNAWAEPRWHCGQVAETDHPVYSFEIVQQGIDKTVRAFIVPVSDAAAGQLQRVSGALACVLGEVERTDDGYVIPVEAAKPHYNRSGIGVTIE